MTGHRRRPLLPGRGCVDVRTLPVRTGIDEATIRSLVESGRLEGLLDAPGGRAVLLFDDVLLPAEELRAWGLSVRQDYRPEDLRGVEMDDAGDDGAEEGGPTWTITW